MKSGLMIYSGGKTKLAEQILRHWPQFRLPTGCEYREPFLGGGGMLDEWLCFNESGNGIGDHIGRVWINDADPAIAALYTAVVRYPDDLKHQVYKFDTTVGLFHALRAELLTVGQMPEARDEIVALGAKKLCLHRISRSGMGVMAGGPRGGASASAVAVASRWKPDNICGHIDRLHALLSALDMRGGGCTWQDFEPLIRDESCPAILYLDPPYVGEGNGLYQFGFTHDDHLRLAAALRATSHPFLLSYDDCELVRDLYSWAQVRPLRVIYTNGGTKRTTELLISPFPRTRLLATSVATGRRRARCRREDETAVIPRERTHPDAEYPTR